MIHGAADAEGRDSRWPDLFVLALMAANVVLNPPQLWLLSARLGARPPFLGDVLGGVVGALGVLTIAGYAALAARRSASMAAKLALVACFAVLYVAVPTASDVATRHAVGLQWNGRYVAFPHDGGVLQTEAATDFLMRGINPYAARYDTTSMARSHHSARELWESLGLSANPAFSFFPYPPLVLAISIPPRWLSQVALGWFDQRFVYLLALVALAASAFAITEVASRRVALVAFLLFCPWQVPHFVQGYNDVLCVLFLALGIGAMRAERSTASGLWLALACGAKQFAWLGVPLWAAWLLSRGRGREEAARTWVRPVAVFAIVAAVLFLPFLVWNAPALFRSLVLAQSQEYPFRTGGLGFSNVLVAAGWVRQPMSGFPAGLIQSAAALLAIGWGVRRVLNGGGVAAVCYSQALAVLAFVFFSRHFASSYLWLPSVLFLIGGTIDEWRQDGAPGPRTMLPRASDTPASR